MITDWFTPLPTPAGPPLRVHALVGGDDAGEQAEDQRLQLTDVQVRQLGERGEGVHVGAGRAALHADVERVAAHRADRGGDRVQQAGDHRHRQHAGYDEPVDHRDAEHLERVELLADLAGAEVGRHRGAGRSRDDHDRRDRRGLLDDADDGDRAGEGAGAELVEQRADLEGQHRTERHRDRAGREQRDPGDEPGLVEELARLERAAEEAREHLECEGEQAADRNQRTRHRARVRCRHDFSLGETVICNNRNCRREYGECTWTSLPQQRACRPMDTALLGHAP